MAGVRHPIRVPVSVRGELFLVLLLAGCSISGDDSPVAVNATPNCEAQAVRCTVYEWNLGVLQAISSAALISTAAARRPDRPEVVSWVAGQMPRQSAKPLGHIDYYGEFWRRGRDFESSIRTGKWSLSGPNDGPARFDNRPTDGSTGAPSRNAVFCGSPAVCN